MKRGIAVLVVAVVSLLSPQMYGDAPRDVVQTNVSKVFDVLRDPKLKAASMKDTKKEKLRVIYYGMFDEVELAKRTLARNWNKLNDAQRKEFVHLFHQVLEKA